MRYSLAEFPQALGDDYDAMAKFRESIAGFGKQWTWKTTEIWAARMLQVCGYIASMHAEFGVLNELSAKEAVTS